MSTTRAREAALLVHGLPDAARTQVLARLDADERAQVEPMLAELAALGIPRLAHPQLEALRAPRVEPSAIERIGPLPLSRLLAALNDAQSATLALLLRVSDWPWRADFLAGLDARRREGVLSLVTSGADAPVAPAVAQALCTRLIERAQRDALARSAGPAPALTGRPGWKRWLRWTR